MNKEIYFSFLSALKMSSILEILFAIHFFTLFNIDELGTFFLFYLNKI